MALSIALSGTDTDPTVREQIEASGGNLHNLDGEAALALSFPGCKPVVFRLSDLESILATLDAPTVEGDGPGATFAQSAVEDSDGNLVAVFSREKRSRKVSIPAEERADVAGFIVEQIAKWEDYEKMLGIEKAPTEE
jgi:hypothetical protein